jgi:hypothetical protein
LTGGIEAYHVSLDPSILRGDPGTLNGFVVGGKVGFRECRIDAGGNINAIGWVGKFARHP